MILYLTQDAVCAILSGMSDAYMKELLNQMFALLSDLTDEVANLVDPQKDVLPKKPLPAPAARVRSVRQKLAAVHVAIGRVQ